MQGETLPKDRVSQLTLYPLTAIEGAERAVLLLTKALQLVQSLGLNEREIRYLLTHAADFDGLSLSQLPTQSSDDTPAERPGAVCAIPALGRLCSSQARSWPAARTT